MKRIVILLSLLLLSSPLYANTLYVVDSVHSQVHFTVPHLMFFKVRGNFTEFTGNIHIDVSGKTLTAAEATINAASIDTRNEERDEHLRSDDFFDVENHPTINFVTKKISGSGDNILVVGDLTIRGKTKEVTLNGSFVGTTTDPQGNQRAGFAATGTIDRRDFNLLWNRAIETGGVAVGDTVEIGLEIAAIRQ